VADRQVDGLSLGMMAAGGLCLWAAIKGKSVTGSITAIIKGQSPSTASAANPITGTGAASGTAPSAGYSIATNIPAGKGSYSNAALQKLWTGNGGPSDTAAFAAAIAEAESGGSATVTSSNPDGGTNVGIFQLDTRGVGAGYTVTELQDANLNTQITIMATNGGTDWTEWGDPVSAAVGGHYTPGSPIP
jgi:hypothetical protein